MLARPGHTLDTTYALQLRDHRVSDPDAPEAFQFHSQAEYTEPGDLTKELELMYGGAFKAPGMHRIVVITRTVLDTQASG